MILAPRRSRSTGAHTCALGLNRYREDGLAVIGQMHTIVRLGGSALAALAVALAVPSMASAADDWTSDDGSASAGTDGASISAGVRIGRADDDSGCEWSPAIVRDPRAEAVGPSFRQVGRVRYQLFARDCAGRDAELHWIPLVTAVEVARSARDVATESVPSPWGSFAPPPSRGVVGLGTWIWADAALWQPVSTTAWIPTPQGPLQVTTTATPVGIVFDPGDGAYGTGQVRCTGRGLTWHGAYGDALPSPCMYTYRRSSAIAPGGAFRASFTVVWEVTYASNRGERGSLGTVQSVVRHSMVVREIQGLVTR